jgi:hypothetical protein
VTYVRYLGLRLGAFCLGALVAAAYFPLTVLFGIIDHRLWPLALIAELVLVFATLVWIRQADLSYVWPALGMPIGFVVAWIVTIIVLISIYGWNGD